MSSTRVASGLLLVFLATVSPLASQSTPDPAGFSVAMSRLELDLELDFEEGSLDGWVQLSISNLGESAVREVPLNVGRLMTVHRAAEVRPSGGTTILDFTQAVSVFTDSPKRQVNHLVVSLDRPLEPGATVEVRLDYGGYLVGYTETGSRYIQDRVDEAFSILREDAFAWPTLGTLSRRANRIAPRPDFDFTASVTVPDGHTVASGGRLAERTEESGRTTFRYESVGPVPFLNLPVARYALLEDEGVRVFHFPDDSVGAQRILESATRGLELLEDWFGPLTSEPELSVMEIPEMWGSQASLTAGIIQTADAFRDAGRMSQLYHELTHLWNAPDLDQPSARWNEGLATFLSLRMSSELDGWDGMGQDVERTAAGLVEASRGRTTLAQVPFIQYGEANATGLSYRVGYLMFYSLHRAMGEAAFDAALGDYYRRHIQIGGTFEDLMDLLRSVSSVELDQFFQTWVYTTDWFHQLAAGERVEDIGLR